MNFQDIPNDNETEFRNSSLEDICSTSGISQKFPTVRTPQQNGIDERRKITLTEPRRTIIIEAGFPLTFWAEVVSTMCYIQYRPIIVKHLGKTSDEILKGTKLDISYFHVIGCVCCILNQRDHCSKFEVKANK
uniref:Integrase catalytic domain-containing protein n=1 Tax=Lactuca sativa TaxID=4236 RepID=A0A9R1UUZ5_LACSA|nr:hypothetical protein LSAT_V11C800446380 [Lactuca sativa]